MVPALSAIITQQYLISFQYDNMFGCRRMKGNFGNIVNTVIFPANRNERTGVPAIVRTIKVFTCNRAGSHQYIIRILRVKGNGPERLSRKRLGPAPTSVLGNKQAAIHPIGTHASGDK